MTAGVPQGSVLGPTLWNLLYDGVLNLQWPANTKTIGFADDLAVVSRAESGEELRTNINEALFEIDGWMESMGLELAPQKTEAVIIRGPRKRNELFFTLRDVDIHPKRAIKYLGMWIDDIGTFGRHITETVRKATDRASNLCRLMPNIGGPTSKKRAVISEVVISTMLYAAPVWYRALEIQRYKDMLESCQRKTLLRIGRAYRTVSTQAIQVITGVVPIHLLVMERRRLYERGEGTTARIRTEERQRTLEEWQREWERNERVGQWTKTVIGNVVEWARCKHKVMGYHLTQFLSGHGYFREYTHRIGKAADDKCIYCGAVDTPVHTLLECPRWVRERRGAETTLDLNLNLVNLAATMLKDPDSWRHIQSMAKNIMSQKEEEERRLQREQQ